MSMSFRTRATIAALFVFAVVSAARAQAPVQTSAEATAPPPDNDFYSLREPAAAGDAQAQFALANHYYRGLGVPQDYTQALTWYLRSANQGFAPAQNQLGNMYQHKFGVPRDYKRALAYYRSAVSQGYAQAREWYLRAAGHGNSDAENQLGYFAEEGWGQPQNYAEALSWFYKAAEQGNSDAENQLGWMYEYGQGVEPDDARALTWYRMAADQGNRHGINNLDYFTAVLEERGSGVLEAAESPVTDAAIEQAQRWATIQDLHRRIAGLEADARHQDDLADQLEHTGKGKSDAITKLFNAIGSVPAVKFHVEAAKYRDQAARLREELARIENQNPSSASVPAP